MIFVNPVAAPGPTSIHLFEFSLLTVQWRGSSPRDRAAIRGAGEEKGMPPVLPPLVERLEFVRAPGLPGVTCMWVENCPTYFRWFHDTFTLSAVTAGVGRFAIGRNRSEVGPQELCAWEPGETHRVTELLPVGPRRLRIATHRAIMIDPALVRRAALEHEVPSRSLHLRDPICGAPEPFRALSRLADSLQSEATQLERESNLALFLASMFEHLLERRPRPRPEENGTRAVREAVEYLLAHSSEHVTLEELVPPTGLDRFRLLRAFKREVGLTPHAFLLQVRLARARRLLARGVPGSVVAAEAGFFDQSHLIRCFRKSVGVTPSRFCPG